MKPVVIETPYGEDPEFYAEYAKACMAHSIEHGEAPFASHILYAESGVLNESKPKQRQQGMEAGRAWFNKAEKVIFYTDFGFSEGMEKAYEIATWQGSVIKRRVLPRFYLRLYSLI